ncbi:MAG: hypothetical protein IJR59_03125 [Firmicutes bacterium]|nr:hypothetical protein [Bacillota bacterium]
MISQWGTYPWFKELGEDLICPDDRDRFKQAANGAKVFECIEKGEYITVRDNSGSYRVKEKLFKAVPSPLYRFGDEVIIKKTGEKAVVTDIMWHYGKQKHYYFICINNKKKTKRYSDEEFE